MARPLSRYPKELFSDPNNIQTTFSSLNSMIIRKIKKINTIALPIIIQTDDLWDSINIVQDCNIMGSYFRCVITHDGSEIIFIDEICDLEELCQKYPEKVELEKISDFTWKLTNLT